MYEFRTLKSIYNISIIYRKPDYSQYEYSSNMIVNAKRNKNDFLFTLEQRIDTKINSKFPEKVMDKLMLELGNAIYPLTLNVSKEAEILSVSNFREVKERWEKNSRKLYNANKTQAFQNYLGMAAKNLQNEVRFRQSLLRDTFIQLFFLNYGNKILEFDFINFPIQSRKSSLYAIKALNSNYHYVLYPAFREKDMVAINGGLNFKKNETGELLRMKLNLILKNDKAEHYVKNVCIEAEAHKVKSGLFF